LLEGGRRRVEEEEEEEPSSSVGVVPPPLPPDGSAPEPPPPPPPPPIVADDEPDDDAPTQPRESVNVQNEDVNPAHAIYFKMLKMGVPEQAVRNKMALDGVDPGVLDG